MISLLDDTALIESIKQKQIAKERQTCISSARSLSKKLVQYRVKMLDTTISQFGSKVIELEQVVARESTD